MFEVPIALVTLVDESRQWFKSTCGFGIGETSRDVSFCAHAIVERDVMVVSDALLDDRFADHPAVVNDPRVRFYAGCPLVLDDGAAVGTLCLVDTRPRDLDPGDIRLLEDLAALVLQELQRPAGAADGDAQSARPPVRGFGANQQGRKRRCRVSPCPKALPSTARSTITCGHGIARRRSNDARLCAQCPVLEPLGAGDRRDTTRLPARSARLRPVRPAAGRLSIHPGGDRRADHRRARRLSDRKGALGRQVVGRDHRAPARRRASRAHRQLDAMQHADPHSRSNQADLRARPGDARRRDARLRRRRMVPADARLPARHDERERAIV